MIEEIKKTYNPFKMWGSWVGLIIGILPIVFFILLVILQPPESSESTLMSVYKSFYIISPPAWLELYGNRCNEAGCGVLTIFLTPAIYFIYGWIIHSLIRKYKR